MAIPFLVLAWPLLLGFSTQADPGYKPYAVLGDSSSFLHEGNIRAVAYFPDGQRIVSACDRSWLKVWDASTGQPMGSSRTRYSFYSLTVTADGKHVVAGTSSGQVVFFNVPGLDVAKTVKGKGTGTAWVSQDASRAVLQNKEKLEFLDLETGKVLARSHKHARNQRLELAISPDGAYAVSADPKGTVRLWNTKKGTVLSAKKVPGDGNNIDVSFSHSSERFVVRTNRLFATTFDVKRPQKTKTWDRASRIYEHPKSAVLLANKVGTLVSIDPKTGRELAQYGRPYLQEILAFSPDGGKAAVVVDRHSLKVLTLPDLTEAVAAGGAGDTLSYLTFSSNGKQVAAACKDGFIYLWDVEKKIPMGSFDARIGPVGHHSLVTALRFSPDGAHLDGLAPRQYFRWEVATQRKVIAQTPERGSSYRWFFPDGKGVLSDIARAGPRTSTIRQSFPGQQNSTGVSYGDSWDNSGAAMTVFSGDGETAALWADEETISLVEAKTGKRKKNLRVKAGRWVRFFLAPDGEELIVIEKEILIVRCKSGQVARRIDYRKILNKNNVFTPRVAALSSDGTLLAVSIEDKEIDLFRVGDGAHLETLKGPEANLRSIGFSPDGRWLAGCGDDRSVHLWQRAVK